METFSDPLRHVDRWRVRSYELDSNGHVNNSVYLSWAEEIATRHAEAAGYGKEWAQRRGGGWVVHHAEITFHRPAIYNDEVELEVVVDLIHGARGLRRTFMRRLPDRELLCEVAAEWVWVRLSDGRPARVPAELVALAADVNAATLAARPRRPRPPG